MTEHTIDYPGLVLGALRAAIAQVLREAAEHGLPGDHHFYITFRTDAPGVELPPDLRREFPDELTIVLQRQFWNLLVEDAGFSVTLRFSGRETDLYVPFAAMTAFADPSVEFGVQLAPPAAASPEAGPTAVGPTEIVPSETSAEDAAEATPGAATKPAGSGDGTVIAFDRNRKRD